MAPGLLQTSKRKLAWLHGTKTKLRINGGKKHLAVDLSFPFSKLLCYNRGNVKEDKTSWITS